MYIKDMSGNFNFAELAESVNCWCEEHQVRPASGQAAEELTERTIRFYRTIGLIDPPLPTCPKTFAEKHKLQLIAIRLLQAKGVKLSRIRSLLYNQSESNLRELARRGADELAGDEWSSAAMVEPERWTAAPVDRDFLLVSRRGEMLPPAVLEQIRAIVQSHRDIHGSSTHHGAL
jgi:DNA-binding transcriptional MerR regulator